MAELLGISIDIKKVDMSRVFVGAKGEYLKLTVSVNDTEDQFGNNVSVWQEQTKEERDAKAQRNFLGNGKILWSGQQQQNQQQSQQQQGGFGQQQQGGFPQQQQQGFGQNPQDRF